MDDFSFGLSKFKMQLFGLNEIMLEQINGIYECDLRTKIYEVSIVYKFGGQVFKVKDPCFKN